MEHNEEGIHIAMASHDNDVMLIDVGLWAALEGLVVGGGWRGGAVEPGGSQPSRNFSASQQAVHFIGDLFQRRALAYHLSMHFCSCLNSV